MTLVIVQLVKPAGILENGEVEVEASAALLSNQRNGVMRGELSKLLMKVTCPGFVVDFFREPQASSPICGRCPQSKIQEERYTVHKAA
jgi:hypothetical protein